MFNGKILVKTLKEVPGTYKQLSYSDIWSESMDIEYDGELTAEVQNAICNAFRNSRHYTGGGSSNGCLRWSGSDSVTVDAEKRQLIIHHTTYLAD